MKIEAAKPALHGIVAEFSDSDEIIEAAKRAREAGYKKMEAYTPFPVHGLTEALDFHDSRISWIVFIGGMIGAIGGFALQTYVETYDYPQNVGGRPFFSWPAFIPVTFECTILLAAFSALIGMLALNGLPKPYNPIFNAPRFELASSDKFFLCIEARDPKFDPLETRRFLEGLGPHSISEVED